jgi:hypothetical protein
MFSDLHLTVTLPTLVNLTATDGDAAELGPDTGEFTLARVGDASQDLPVFLHFGGVASNGVDFIALTNVVTLPATSNEVKLLVVPFLDHRTEGDEPLTLTIVSNVAYTIGASPATVMIHDSPYGQWTVNHFTLEELTDPTMSGETADFDHDTLNNFVEYAANLDPKLPATNQPLAVTVETNALGSDHLTLTYTRRLPPTDTTYAPALSYDLATWLTGTNYFEEFSTVADTNGFTETVKTRLVAPYPSGTNQFFTIRVELQATGP